MLTACTDLTDVTRQNKYAIESLYLYNTNMVDIGEIAAQDWNKEKMYCHGDLKASGR